MSQLPGLFFQPLHCTDCLSFDKDTDYLTQGLPVQEQIVLKEEAEAGSKAAWNKLYYMPAQADRCTGTRS